ncbi:alpha-ketoacid dehydrogenase subunit alpha/beta [Nonlabens marinus]|uniref:Branched-chain alpha-keto acid dehydrogenase, E1 component, alpha subunit n=1 Tax=Nonlabens marinus S1-08 TaxID=1454201 RepID=W8VXQ1_9FLAO|nr:dehydrogenase E1 component subunit alpha/beta [Nonlabens marinus]BAO56317.1 branched-chain alpha-keto acid dehydrogenase, E1 component, alpha subunit [Nonlabens marinus S1-08]
MSSLSIPDSIKQETSIKLFKAMLLPRLVEEKMLILLRQGRISKWFSGIGQEAISIGVTMAMEEEEYILPMHRNLGVFTCRNIPLWKLFAQWQGKTDGFTKGRDRSFHFGTQEYKIIGMISHLGPQLGVADGIALAQKLKKTKKATVVFTGEGGTSEGDFHEALNVASVWDLPVLFCIENNGYGLSTPTSEQYRCKDLADRGIGYGIESHIIDGNNIVEVYSKIKDILEEMREQPRPVLVEFKTFRLRGHEEASGTKYVPDELTAYWEARDPVELMKQALLDKKWISDEDIDRWSQEFKNTINEDLEIAFAKAKPTSSIEQELADVYKPNTIKYPALPEATQNIRFVDAIHEGLKGAMRKHEDLVIMGQDVAEYGGVFKITDGFLEEFSADRVRNTPICESAIVEAGMGLSIAGMKAVVEMQFADFVSSGFNPIVNYLAKSYYRWGQQADVVIRMPCGAGVGAGPFHSQTNESWFYTIPGLKIVYPAFPEDAKGLLAAAIDDPNPVLFFEHKALYRSVYGEVPVEDYGIELGKSRLVREGKDLSIITYGAGVHWACQLNDELMLSIDIIDLRTLVPLDKESIIKSIQKTGKALVLTEDNLTGSIASDIASMIGHDCFEQLDAPVVRVGSIDTPIPFHQDLERRYLPINRLRDAIKSLLEY